MIAHNTYEALIYAGKLSSTQETRGCFGAYTILQNQSEVVYNNSGVMDEIDSRKASADWAKYPHVIDTPDSDSNNSMPDFRSRRHHRGGNSVLHSFLQKIFFPKTHGYISDVVLLSRIVTYAFFGLIACIVIGFGLFLWYGRDLPTPGKLVNNDLSQSTRIYDRNGILLYSVYQSQNRVYVNLSDIPKMVQQATIAVEDKNFYTNQGFSLTGYARALVGIITLHGISGGSTLTQQLVKNVLLQDTRQVLSRKIKELMLSIQVDRKYTKNQILEMYLNDVGYGGATTGVEAASEYYFGKHVKDLDLAQSAFLAGLPQSPTAYNPYNGQKYYIDRTNVVLQAMANQGYVSQKQADAASKEVGQMTFSSAQNADIKAPWFVLHVKELAAAQFGEQMVENGGLQIYTTLDYTIQQKAEQIVKDQIAGLKNYNVGNGAAVVRDPKTGEVLAMVGSKDYFADPAPKGCNPSVNCVFTPNTNAAMSNRQPGSSLKPILYATAFEKGYTAASEVMDVQTDFPTGDPKSPTYTPVNYTGKFNGPIELRFALGNSLNIPAVKMLARVGVKDFMTNAYNMGIANWQPTDANLKSVGLSLVLGGRETTLLDETTAYGVFATGGIRHDPVFIKKVTDNKGSTIFESHPDNGTRVMPEDITFLISHILSDNNARTLDFGAYSSLVVPGKTVSVKTGTTDDKRDNWTVGYTPSYVVGVWVGNNDNEPMNQALASGITGAAPIWNSIMSYVLKGKPNDTWLEHPPSDVQAMQIDATFGGLPEPGQPSRSEYFIKGTEPTAQSPVYQTKDGKVYFVVREDDPVSTDGQNRWQAGIDAWIKTTHSAADASWYPPDDLLKQLNINPTQATTPTPTPGH